MKQKNKYSQKAFTLIEVLLVLSLLSVISVAVYRALANGLAIWEKRSQTDTQEDILIFFEKLTEDLQKAVPFSRIPFDGQKSSVSFAALIKTPADRAINGRNDEYVEQIGQVEYYFDSMKKSLVREQKNYSQAVNKKSGSERVLVQGLLSVKFDYFYKENDAYTAVSEIHEAVPAVIMVTLKFLEEEKEKTVSRTVIIPVGTNE